MAKLTKKEIEERDEARATLRAMLPPGTTVYTVLRHVSASGMMREISLHGVDGPGVTWLTGLAARAMSERIGKREGIRAGGCGMDMGFHIVSTLSRILYPDGFGCIGEGCPSNDHSNGDRDRTPHEAAEARECPSCKGSGKASYTFFKERLEDCRTCAGAGKLEAGHWHRSGDYALPHRWI